jgi:hypothetical protein
VQQESQLDSALESLIDAAFDLMLKAETPEAARQYFAQMGRLIAQRSPERIFTMEVERRLRVVA